MTELFGLARYIVYVKGNTTFILTIA